MGTGHKPRIIKALEDAIFTSIFAIAVGSSPEYELYLLVNRWKTLREDPTLQSALLWFANLGGELLACSPHIISRL